MNSPLHQRKLARVAAILALGFLFLSHGAFGFNSVPYAENFQDAAYPHGTLITNLTGWSASASDSSTIVTNDFIFETVTRPMTPSGDNKVLELNTGGGVLTNAFSMTDGQFPALYLDTMINLVAHGETPDGLAGNADVKLGVFLNGAGLLEVFHGGADGDTDSFTEVAASSSPDYSIIRQWWEAPELRNASTAASGDGPTFWTKDKNDQFLFVTVSPGNQNTPALLYSIPELRVAGSEDEVLPIASVQTASELGIAYMRGGAVSVELGRVLTGTAGRDPSIDGQQWYSTNDTPVYGSFPTDGTEWTSNNVARISPDQNIIFDGMGFNSDSTKLYTNMLEPIYIGRSEIHTWNVGDLTTDGVGLTLANTYTSSVNRVKNLSVYHIAGKDLVYFGEAEGTGTSPVLVYDPATESETLLVADPGGDVMNVKVSGIGTDQMYLYVGHQGPSIGMFSVWELNADGLGVGARVVDGFIFTQEVLGLAPAHTRGFEVTNDGLFAFFGYHSANPKKLYTVASAPAQVPDPTLAETWYRLTVEMDMVAAEAGGVDYPFFRVLLDGNVMSAAANAFANPSLDPLDYSGGSWFRFANATAQQNAGTYRKVQQLAFQGSGMIDDLVLSNVAPVYDGYAGMYWIRSLLLGEGGNVNVDAELLVAAGAATDVVYSADQWYEIKSFEHNGALLTTLTGATAYTAEYVNASYNISNHVVFGVIMTDGAPATWYGPIWGDNPPSGGSALSLLEAWLLNQEDMDVPFAIIDIGLDVDDKPYVQWLSSGPANGDVWLWHTADLTTGWDYPPLTDGVTVHDSGTNTWTSATVADTNLFYYVEIVDPGTTVPTQAP